MQHQIRTILKHEDNSSGLDRERGSRYWSEAEVLSSTWFVVEACTEASGQFMVRRWVTSSIGDAARIQQRQEPCQWSRVLVCMRAPLSERSGLLFEEVSEAYLSSPGSYIYRLSNGMAVMTDTERLASSGPGGTRELSLVYARRP